MGIKASAPLIDGCRRINKLLQSRQKNGNHRSGHYHQPHRHKEPEVELVCATLLIFVELKGHSRVVLDCRSRPKSVGRVVVIGAPLKAIQPFLCNLDEFL